MDSGAVFVLVQFVVFGGVNTAIRLRSKQPHGDLFEEVVTAQLHMNSRAVHLWY